MAEKNLSWGVCVPTLNAGKDWRDWLAKTNAACGMACRKLVIDSSSIDGTPALAHEYGWEVVPIQRCDFDHGGTRQWALSYLRDCDIIIFLTQDALVDDPSALIQLVKAFEDPCIGAAFGRQLPHLEATPIAAHARYFNYPAQSRVVDKGDIPNLGIKAAFLSNSFTAYRRDALLAVDGFPEKTILSEDMIAGARLLKGGWKLAYCSQACVLHSHNYSLLEEFRRYFDIGVLHHREAWLLEWLGNAEGEGIRFVVSELGYTAKKAFHRLPEVIVRTSLKYLGYRLGRLEKHLPAWIKPILSMHTSYWNPRN
ncbi:glycosyltransferase [Halomonas sp. ATBC28]|uniref:glycosyltransferase n=1 Tax=Halomonadaceae TaxID=28256 RepID=UPI0004809807|nr:MULTISPECIES: glycosyltransferase [Halomonas]NAO96735.1 glycosyltransferase [Halomonas sp. MG34]QGQ69949.1 glycosyltransferase [Halomonas sp. PA16-9]KIN16313.1 rhamnosyltransferase [Halomonas sp. KHS3]PKH63313.1 rhamnosyltransferase [Halomonas sp. Choline-3u-9]TMU17994.1 glycosyltransferase [Halomonas sp. ATBC28]